MKNKNKGIFCLEGLWAEHNIEDKSSVLPILELLEKQNCCNYIYHDCVTKDEFEFYLSKWKLKYIQEKYPILYFAFHGEPGCIYLNNKLKYTLEELSDYLESKCIGKVVYFGSCSTLDIDKRLINNFLIKTGAIAAIGYKKPVDWIQSAACDLFVFEALQIDKLDTKGISKIYESIINNYGNLHKILDLRVVINDKIHFKRTRK